MRNIKAILEYDGADFNGWQWQPKGRTVQGVLQSSLERLIRESPKVISAGRTDAGVHALGQVVNFKTETRLKPQQIKSGLNSYLPDDIRVLEVQEVPQQFHARHDATKRFYRYVISTRPKAIGRQYAWHCRYALDLGKMKTAASFLPGSHVFKGFAKLIENEPHYLCDVESAQWIDSDDRLVFEISANRFLHHMVRMIVGTLVEVGRGKYAPEYVKQILDVKELQRVIVVAPPQGLFLVKVYY